MVMGSERKMKPATVVVHRLVSSPTKIALVPHDLHSLPLFSTSPLLFGFSSLSSLSPSLLYFFPSLWLFLSLFPLLTPPLLLPFTFLHLLSLPIHYPFPYRSAQITVVMPTHANWLLGPSAVQGLAATAPVSSGPMAPHAELRLVSAT